MKRDERADNAALERRLARLRELAGPAAANAVFAAGFTDRVMARLDRPASLADGLQAAFFRLAPLAAAAALVFAVVNVLETRSGGQPLLDRVLGLPSVSVASAYKLDTDLSAWTEAMP